MPVSHRNKILFIPSWYPCKNEQALGNFVKRLVEANSAFDDVAVLYVSPDENPEAGYSVDVSNASGFPEVTVYFPKTTTGLFAPIKRLRHRFNAYNKGMQEIKKIWGTPQLVHVQVAFPAILYASRLKKLQGIPYVLTEHSAYYIATATPDRYKRSFRFFKKAIEGAEKIITVSGFLAKGMQGKGVRNTFTVIPNVVALPGALPDIFPPVNKKRIIHVSTLAEVKNIKGILRVIKRISNLRQDFELVIVGETELPLKETIQYATTLGLSDNVVKFQGYLPHDKLAELILSSNFMLMFSNHETFSVVLAESLWVGRPVIATRCGGPQEFIKDDFGMLVQPGNEQELEEAVIKMLDTWQQYNAESMKKFARENFAPAVVGEKMHAVHSSVLQTPA